MIVFAFTAAMLLTALAAYAANQMIVVGFIVVLLLTGLFIFQFQDHPSVREWVEKYF
jgi:MFS-type transporter involved in bile tolerance (Atg22 family)